MLVCIETCFTPKSLFVLSFKRGFKGKQKGRLNEDNTMNGIGFKSRAEHVWSWARTVVQVGTLMVAHCRDDEQI